ncbi:MAG TPA: class I SAM-dependent methyltransferase [Cyclobacteriaceae bacterium]|jgi:predicted O-methyltransferase YrrM|nr:class I SAM-dependent methyltransferase [Cyclobacteriaceae bacterium]
MVLHHISAYVSHWLNVVNEHSIHSPFFYDFYTKVVKGKSDLSRFSDVEKLRDSLLHNSTEVIVNDLGAGSKILKKDKQTLEDIAATCLNSEEFTLLFNRILHYIEAKRVVELGTSLGITTLYLAKKKDCHVTTFEGSHSLINVALTNFEYLDVKNIDLIEGNIDHTLSDFLQNPAKIHFVLMDANHQYEPTLRYFNLLTRRMADKGIIVVDDIHWSADMQRAWKELCQHELVYGSVDLFRCGLLFFDPTMTKQHYVWSL